MPNAGRKVVRLPYRMEWDPAFRSYIKGLDDKKPVILCGDLNVAHLEIGECNNFVKIPTLGPALCERSVINSLYFNWYS